MDFFQYQEAARKRTGVLVVCYILAVILIIAAVYGAFFIVFQAAGESKSDQPFTWAQLLNPTLLLWVTLGTLTVVLAGTLYKTAQLAAGGEAVATMLGGRPINRNTTDLDERKVLNVVEEMAIASGTPVPRAFVLDNEDGINAFAAGFSPGNAVVAVTRGCMEQLSRDELQGVVAHEFSHIMNGDMRLNLRLTGVLHGILVIAVIGYWTLRVAARSSGGRSRGKGGGAFILLGLLLLIIGYVGVFFGKLIKSAVSRQREFLADASAVQFTRNPAGIGGALMKIGGFARGSRVQDSHAEEASHFFFANGLAKGFLSLFTTHPPIEERIRRIDTALAAGIAGGKAHPQARPPAAKDEDEADGVRGTLSQLAAGPGAVLSQVGAPTRQHLDHAAGLVADLPPSLVHATKDTLGATALIYCLLLSKEPETKKKQLDVLSQPQGSPALAEAVRLISAIEGLGAQSRIALAAMSIPALKELSPAQYAQFRESVERMVMADEQIDLFEYTLQRMIMRHIDPVFSGRKLTVVRHRAISPLLPSCAELLSCLAYWGADDINEAKAAFEKGAARLDPGLAGTMLPADKCGLDTLDKALKEISAAAPALKGKVLDASVTCAFADLRVTDEEAELLRAIADSLDCPLPPFLPARGAN